MQSTPKYLGMTLIYSKIDNYWRTWHISATCKADGELYAIYYGNSLLIINLIGPIQRRQCDTWLKKKIWKFAEEKLLVQHTSDHEISKDFATNFSNVIPMDKYNHAK